MSKKKVKLKKKVKRAYKKKNVGYWKTEVFKVRNARPDVKRKKAKAKPQAKKTKAKKGKK